MDYQRQHKPLTAKELRLRQHLSQDIRSLVSNESRRYDLSLRAIAEKYNINYIALYNSASPDYCHRTSSRYMKTILKTLRGGTDPEEEEVDIRKELQFIRHHLSSVKLMCGVDKVTGLNEVIDDAIDKINYILEKT